MLPADVSWSCFARSPTATLIVENKPVLVGETQELREQVVMVRARPTVEDEKSLRTIRPVFAPAEWHLG